MGRPCSVRGWLSAGLLLALAAGGAAAAEDDPSATVVKGEAPPLARRLKAADQLAGQRKWAEALDEYQHLLDEGGDALVPVDAGRRLVQARRLVHARLAALPAAALRRYRGRVDDAARAWLKQGAEAHDVALLRRVVDEAFCSRPAEEALDLLGDLAFERGDLGAARAWWGLLAPPPAAGKRADDDLAYPDPQPDRAARARAKQLIARLFQGDRSGLAEDLRAFRKRHGQASGPLAGATGSYAATVRKLMDRAGPAVADEVGWPTFAGAPSRNLVPTRPLPPRISAEGARWSVRLDTGERAPEPDPKIPPELRVANKGSARSLAFLPVIAGGLVLWADARHVNGHDLLTGRRVFRYDLLRDGKLHPGVLLGNDDKLPAPAGLRYSLSVAGGRVYARLGAQGLSPRRQPRFRVAPDTRNSFLVCLSLEPEARGRPLWLVKSRTLDTDPARFFEGAPLVRDGRVYAALSLVEAGQTRTTLACYDAETGRPLWRREACETRTARESGADPRRFRHHLLTLAGTNLVYCTHAGAVVAVDARTGRPAWAVRYASRGPETEDGDPSPRDLTPALYDSGRVYLAPLDGDRLLCLDAGTGRTLWDRDRIEVVHLLGAADGRLVFTTPRGVRAVDAATGLDAGGWSQPAEGRLPGFGRGLLAGGWVYLPTANPEMPLLPMNVADGSPVKDGEALDPNRFHRLERGNLAYGDGCLAVAGTEVLYLYAPEERYLPERRAAAALPGAPAAAFYRLARAEEGAGLYRQALEHLARAEQAKADEMDHREPVRTLARRARQEIDLDLAGQRQAEKDWDGAAAWLRQASAAGLPVSGRLEALRRLAELWIKAGKPDRAVAAWQAILDDPALRRSQVSAARGTPAKARDLAADRIAEIIRRHGPAVYGPVEKRAKALLATARGKRPVEVLEQLARQYPNAAVTGPALLRLARLYEEAGRPVRAAWAYRTLLQRGAAASVSAKDLAPARAGLARALERQHSWEAARRAWQELAERDGDLTLPDLDERSTVRAFVARRLRGPQYQAAPPTDLDLQLPLLRRWPSLDTAAGVEGEPAGRLLVPEGRSSHAGRRVALFVRGAGPGVTLTCRDADTGKPRWEAKLPQAPTWAGFQGGAVLLAGPGAVVCLALSDGKPLWEFDSPAVPLVTPGPSADRTLSAFRQTRTRLFFLQGERRLFALDTHGGRVCWSHWAPAAEVRPLYPAGRFNPHYHAGEDWVVVQSGGGKRLVIASRSGRLAHEVAGDPGPWPRPPLALGERRLCLVPDAGRVVLFDPATGKDAWTYPASPGPDSTLTTGEPPYLFGGPGVLLVLLSRNYGYQLERLDPDTGRPLWRPAGRVLRQPPDPGRVGLGRTAFCYATRKALHARSLADGKPLWSRPLPEGGTAWRVVCCGSWVMAYPLARKLRHRGTGLPVLLCDGAGGRLVQRLNFPDPPGEPVVAVGSHRLTVEVGGRAWGLGDAARTEKEEAAAGPP